MAIVSVVAQLQFYNFTRSIRELGKLGNSGFPDPESIAEHIYQFSLAGLKGMLEGSSS
jgi:hypothetical protein